MTEQPILHSSENAAAFSGTSILKEMCYRVPFFRAAARTRARKTFVLGTMTAVALMGNAWADDAAGITVPAGETAVIEGETIVDSSGAGSAATLADGAKLESVNTSFEGYNGITLGSGNSVTMTGGSIKGSNYAINDPTKTSGAVISLDGVTLEGGNRAVYLGQAKLNLTNCTLSTSESNGSSLGLTVYDKTEVLLSNTLVTSQWYGAYVRTGSTLNVTNGSSILAQGVGVGLLEEGTLNVESGTRIETKGENSMAIYLCPKSYQEGPIPVESIKLDMIVVNINGGTIVSSGTGIQGVGSYPGTTVNINGGSIVAEDLGIFQPQYGLLNISAGSITGDNTAIEVRAGEVNISGGTFTSHAAFAERETPPSGGSSIVGAALAVSQHSTNMPIKVQISGGTFSGEYALYEKDLKDSAYRDQITMSVSGGDFYGKIYSQNCKEFITGGNFNDASALRYLGQGAQVNVKLAESYVAAAGDAALSIDGNSTVNLDLNGKNIEGDISLNNGSTLNFTTLDILPSKETAPVTLRNTGSASGNIINGSLIVNNGSTVNVDTAITVESITLGAGTITNVNGALVTAGTPAISVADASSSSIEQGATININGLDIKAGETLQLFSKEISQEELQKADLRTDNIMQQIVAADADGSITIEVKDASSTLPGLQINNIITSAAAQNSNNGFVNDLLTSGNAAQAVRSLNSAANMGEMVGVNRSAYSMMGMVTDTVNNHLSQAHGDLNREFGRGVWANYINSTENVRGMRLAGLNAAYDAHYNGIVLGCDKQVTDKTTLGIALNWAEGDVKSVGGNLYTRNEAEYCGLSLYGRSINRYASLHYDISYLRSDNDLTQYNNGYVLTAAPRSNALSLGTKAEKSLKTAFGRFLPYTGLRYMHLATKDYSNNIGMRYDVDAQNIWMLPIGMNYSYERAAGNWTLRAIAGAGYVWAFGDTEADQTVSLGGGADSFSFDMADSGSFVGRLSVEAEKGCTTFGAGYEYQKGDTVSTDRWMLYVNRVF